MKQIFQNRYLKTFRFSTSSEALSFFKNQKANNNLFIEDTLGDNYYCYVCYHSLTKEKLFALAFSSDENEDDLNLLFWDNSYVLDTGEKIYLINPGHSFLFEWRRNKVCFSTEDCAICLLNA